VLGKRFNLQVIIENTTTTTTTTTTTIEQYRVSHPTNQLEEVYYIADFLTPQFTKLLEEILVDSRLSSSSLSSLSSSSAATTTTSLWTRLAYSQRNVAVFDLKDTDNHINNNHCHVNNNINNINNDNINNNNNNKDNIYNNIQILLTTLAKALVQIKAFPDDTHPPNHVLINEYDASGGIMPHTDGPMYMDRTATFSIGGGDVLFRFQKIKVDGGGGGVNGVSGGYHGHDDNGSGDHGHDDNHSDHDDEVMQIKLHGTGSLIVFAGDAYTHHYHSIRDRVHDGVEYANEKCVNVVMGSGGGGGGGGGDGNSNGGGCKEQVIQRGHRISLTFRHKYKS